MAMPKQKRAPRTRGRGRSGGRMSRRRSDRVPESAGASLTGRGTLIVIGGREDKENGREILSKFVECAAQGTIAVVTVASEEPDALWAIYSRVFRELGAADVRRVDVE